MRSMVKMGWLALLLAVGCAGRQDLETPDYEAIYDVPLEEMWPSVREYFTAANLPYREDRGSLVLETEWKQEFGGSKIAGYWHRYMVIGKRETPTKSKLWIIRITKSVNKALSQPGKELDWGIAAARTADSEGSGSLNLSPEDEAARLSFPVGENAFYMESGQGTRDLTMEWRVFRGIMPKLAKKQAVSAEQQVAKAPGAKEAPTFTECGQSILGLKKLAKAGGVLLLGELHGTQEVPRFIAQSVCQLVTAGMPVTVGLELPVENEERITTFLQSQGGEVDWLKLMEAPFWRSPYPDGRGSEAVANMLEQLRHLRAQGLDVAVFVYDHPKLSGQPREDALTKTVLSQVKAKPERFHLVVSGNVHPRTAKGLPWDKQYKPMGYLLKDQLDDVMALDMAYDSGTAWICAADTQGRKLDCGVKEAKGKDNGDRFFMHTWSSANKDGYHGVFYVGHVTASEPAVLKGLGNPNASAAPSPASGL
ncbi:putative lipoprotein [Corallococcus coralloides DSM 2259]|uniref:Putative lipoprotein n=1 Tax=Corallococcus coralloides (strain ATCC 25202 / DSM 2259 / NBRC 100086 / M2) TaxID=1144275 RepID=H8MLH8_CORCM|nr:putative lipoprotein [Corallococcus coralloides DSM 2259]